jgi:menaquinone-dependent protoporphyrinogen IX oxidase
METSSHSEKMSSNVGMMMVGGRTTKEHELRLTEWTEAEDVNDALMAWA